MGGTPFTLRVEDYTIGWICALPLEMAAAIALLDERHGNLPQPSTDHNSYQPGRIGQHNVILACLPAGVTGTTSAATVAAQLLSTFTSIKYGLMVGIGGGVPSKQRDIRLGDIVVSQPTLTFGGVVQYDFGKTIQQGQFISTGSLDRPPAALLTTLARLKANDMVEGNKLATYISDLWRRNPRMSAGFSHQGSQNDKLFQADYDHVGTDDECRECDESRLVLDRPVRSSHEPHIHYGVIASGNQVMKHGITRDRISKECSALCFEMEAAGLMDNFPCLVIRGICDYSDSHKNKRWQGYAAVVAAAYAKELLYTAAHSELANKEDSLRSQSGGSIAPHYFFLSNIRTGSGKVFQGEFNSGGGPMNF